MLSIGNISLDSPLVQAALSGYSDLPMRRIARRHGAAYALNEVVLDKLVVQPGKAQRAVLDVPDDDHPVGGQLMGAEPEQFGRAAELMIEGGYDVIDINFGCPVKKVLGRCRGGYLLSQPKDALEIVARVVDAVAGRAPVSVKMRRGMDDSAESERAFFEILDGAIGAGVAAVTVHGRTVQQRYVGPSRWAFLKRVKRHVGDAIPVLGSGDLFAARDVKRMLDETGVDGVTIARGCIGNPWIFDAARALLAGESEPAPPTVPEQGRVMGEHLDLMAEHYGAKLAAKLFRKFAIRYIRLHPNGDEMRDACVRASSLPEWRLFLDRWYDPGKVWPAATGASSQPDLIAAGATP